MAYPVNKTEEQWRSELDALAYHVLREAGTERPFSGVYNNVTAAGIYRCRGCNQELFASHTKFDAACGWPSFYEPLNPDAIEYVVDNSLGMSRTEVRCSNCGSHLGHVFTGEGYPTPTDQRYCINSVSLQLEREDGGAPPAESRQRLPYSSNYPSF